MSTIPPARFSLLSASNSAVWQRLTFPGFDATNSFDWAQFPCLDGQRCGRVRLPPGHTCPYHRHPVAEYYVPKKGSCSLMIDGHLLPFSADSNDGLFIPSNTPHGFFNDSDQDFELLYFYLPPPTKTTKNAGEKPSSDGDGVNVAAGSRADGGLDVVADGEEEDKPYALTFLHFPSGEPDERVEVLSL